MDGPCTNKKRKTEPNVARGSTMTDMPIEIFEEVLNWLTTKHILSCRLINRHWNGISSALCRRRDIKLKPRAFYTGELAKLFSTCKKKYVPWSSCTINNNDYYYHTIRGDSFLTVPQSLKFIKCYGTHIRKLTLEGNNYKLAISLLKSTPNLEHFVCAIGGGEYLDFGKIIEETQGSEETPLRFLKRLEVNSNQTTDVKFIEFLIRSFQLRLDYLRLRTSNQLSTTEFDTIGTFLAGIPFISLTLSCRESLEFLKSFVERTLQIHQLEVSFGYPVTSYRPLEVLFADISRFLTKLIINDMNYSSESTTKLKIPSLPNLKELEILCSNGTAPPPPCQFLVPFTTNQFPSCRKVKVVGAGGNMSWSEHGFDRFFANVQFDSVTELVLHNHPLHHPMRTDWINIFPNLRKLNVNANKESLRYIFTRMRTLEELELVVNLDRVYDSVTKSWVEVEEDVNLLLSGVSNPPGFNQSLTCRRREREAHHSSLLSLSGLKRLSLQCIGSELNEVGVNGALLKMQQLEYLCLRYCKISSECEEKLRRHHKVYVNWELTDWFDYLQVFSS